MDTTRPPASFPDARRFIRAGAVASILGLSERTVRRLIADGSLPSIRVRGARLIAVADLTRFLRPQVATFADRDADATAGVADEAHFDPDQIDLPEGIGKALPK